MRRLSWSVPHDVSCFLTTPCPGCVVWGICTDGGRPRRESDTPISAVISPSLAGPPALMSARSRADTTMNHPAPSPPSPVPGKTTIKGEKKTLVLDLYLQAALAGYHWRYLPFNVAPAKPAPKRGRRKDGSWQQPMTEWPLRALRAFAWLDLDWKQT